MSAPNPWLICLRPSPRPSLRLLCFPPAGSGADRLLDGLAALPVEVELYAVQLPAGKPSPSPLIPALAEPFAFFGHGTGALRSFELARELRRVMAPAPAHLFLSACAAPSLSAPPGPLDTPITVFGALEDDTLSLHHLDAWRVHTTGPFRLELFPGDHSFPFTAGPSFLPTFVQTLGSATSAACPPPEADEVHVWRARLDRTEDELRALSATLAPDERDRAGRFHFPRDRDHFIAGRGLLRAILAGYLRQDPAELRFTTNAYGKPLLAAAPQPLRFNVTHSRDFALYAITQAREVGVDVEWLHKDLDLMGLAERFFSAREAAGLRALAPEARREAFFACWTRKEAYVKAHGQGLSLGLDTFDVSLVPNGPPALLRTPGELGAADGWSVYGFTPAPGYAAALAVEGSAWRLLWRHWPP